MARPLSENMPTKTNNGTYNKYQFGMGDKGLEVIGQSKKYTPMTRDQIPQIFGMSTQPSSKIHGHNDTDPRMRGISISPYGFANAPRGEDPMGRTGTITNNSGSAQLNMLSRIASFLAAMRGQAIQ